MKLDEHLQDGARKALVHGEALARPVAGCAKARQLALDGAFRLRLPGPDELEKLLAPEGAAVGLAARGKLSLHHHLGGDAGVIGAGLPEHVPAAHALEAAEDVLQGIVEGVRSGACLCLVTDGRGRGIRRWSLAGSCIESVL